MRRSYLFALLGLALGTGAPVGAFVLYWATHDGKWMDFWQMVVAQETHNEFFYTYMLLGTSFFFSLFGFSLGRYTDIIRLQNQKLSRQALTDPLTGLGNHRFLHQAFQEHYRNRRSDSAPVSCLMMDLDLFKKVNDTYGHPFGDEVLRGFAGIVKKVVRPGDVAARYGGEEFLCILPNCGPEEAGQVAERIRQETEKHLFLCHQKAVPVTISAGTATHPGGSGDYKQLIEEADEALYRAKAGGRNRVVTTSIPEERK